MKNTAEPLQTEEFYHVYNRANGFEKIFLSKENYRFFLRRYKKFIAPIVHTHCFCLMPNHFHLLIEVKTEEEVLEFAWEEKLRKAQERQTLPKFRTLEEFGEDFNSEKFISKQFANFFSSYTQAFNKQRKRMGSLFMKNFKRKRIDSDQYLRTVVAYIHQNPLAANMIQNLREWEFSSYLDYVLTNEYDENQQFIINKFGGKEMFLEYHNDASVLEDDIVLN